MQIETAPIDAVCSIHGLTPTRCSALVTIASPYTVCWFLQQVVWYQEHHASPTSARPPLADRHHLARRNCADLLGLHVANDRDASPRGGRERHGRPSPTPLPHRCRSNRDPVGVRRGRPALS